MISNNLEYLSMNEYIPVAIEDWSLEKQIIETGNDLIDDEGYGG